MTYTTNLMDKLERIKAEHANNETILDDMAAQAFVEQFALETFQRADNAVRANKVTAQTAETFRAAATFLDLMVIWSTPEAEITAKSKYAKYHAVRIVKALKAGEDPNATNPAREPEPAEDQASLDPTDPEVQRINNPSLQPTVEDVNESFQPSPAVSAPLASPALPPNGQPAAAPPDVSPLEPSPGNSRQGSVGGGYFPTVPTFTSEKQEPSLPTAPADDVDETMGGTSDGLDAQNFYNPTAPEPQLPAPPAANPFPPVTSSLPPPPAPMPIAPGSYRTDDAAVAAAEKHARWAISVLNFEDVETAVKELRTALQSLGAS